MPDAIYLLASGDLRLSANQKCWPAQAEMEAALGAAFAAEGREVRRAHPFDDSQGHGFIDSQKMGLEVFRTLPPDAPVVIAEAVWQYSHHVLAGLTTHRGPILTVANWSGTWPGLVGMLNLNGSLTKAGVRYSTLWSENFTDDFFRTGLRRWLKKGRVKHDADHVQKLSDVGLEEGEADAARLGRRLARRLRRDKAIMGVFDEGCMGMFNAIVPDELLHPTGVFKERLSQASLYARTRGVKEPEARAVYDWLVERGMRFEFGPDEANNLTLPQVLGQCRMYVAAVRMAAESGCSTIGIQYQQGLKELLPASDLVEGILNNVDRPPVHHAETGAELYAGEALPHFNEVDECAGLDALVTNRVWRALGFPPETTLHDLRWGRHYVGPDGTDPGREIDAYVWVFLISGAAPAAHFVGGWAGASSERQPAMYFAKGGGTLKGISKPGWIVWSRVYIEKDELRFDTGLAEVVSLPAQETEERWRLTTPQWPIMHAVLQGITRDQMMGRHKANHIQVAYGPDRAGARAALFAKAAAMAELGLKVFVCGEV